MALSVNMMQPVGWGGQLVCQSGNTYTPNALGVISVAQADVDNATKAGFLTLVGGVDRVLITAPVVADLVSISAAAIATNRALTIAAQPPHARKLQTRQVIVTAITAGILTIIGIDQDGNNTTEVESLIAAATQTLKSKYAYASVTSATVSGLVGGGDGTLGIGLSNDFGVPTIPGQPSGLTLVCTKATKITAVLGTSVTAADDDAATTTVDSVARTIAPTTAPSATGLINYELSYSFGVPGTAAST